MSRHLGWCMRSRGTAACRFFELRVLQPSPPPGRPPPGPIPPWLPIPPGWAAHSGAEGRAEPEQVLGRSWAGEQNCNYQLVLVADQSAAQASKLQTHVQAGVLLLT